MSHQNFFSFIFLFNLLLSNGRSRSFCKPIMFFGMNYLPFINGGTTLNKISLLTSVTVCIEPCGTGDISSSIVTDLYHGPQIFM